ncbi:hypothetical protein [Microbacterium sp. NPDC079995]|uniref:hypothetical protein n=1 Tax=unclassified Microbacterium TaxID=2609290 RepID=UPI00344C339D
MDFSALTDPVDRAVVKAFNKKHVPRWSVGRGTPALTAAWILLLLATLVAVIFVPALILGHLGMWTWPEPWEVLLLALVIMVVPVTWRYVNTAWDPRVESPYRVAEFTKANGLIYAGREYEPRYPGILFTKWRSTAADPTIHLPGDRFVEIGNYSGRGYVAIKLDAPLPHIVLDGLAERGVVGGRESMYVPDPDQRLRLEGEFDRHFALYCPSGYEKDALYLFAPDIMARFIDTAARLDAEIVDDWLFLYAKGPLVTIDPDTWTWLLVTVRALSRKVDQWARWRDDTLRGSAEQTTSEILTPPPGVGDDGRRLRQVTSPRTAVTLVLGFCYLVVAPVLILVFAFR